MCSLKKVFSKISSETFVQGSLFKKVEDQQPATLLKRNSSTGAFLQISQKYLRTLFLRNTAERLLLEH